MRRISLIACLVVGALGVLPDTAEAQIFRRRRATGQAYAAPMPAAYSDCGPSGVVYGGPMQAGYAAGYPNFAGGQPMPSPNLNIMIRDGAFEPSRINVRVGDTVRWTNNGQKPHTVTADDGSWDSGSLEPGKTYSHKFDKAGTFNYHCDPHKDAMKASVVVSAAAEGSVPPPPPKGDEPLPKQLDK
jgi:plastocyanin